MTKCLKCGKEFEPKYHSKFCSGLCRKEYQKEYNRNHVKNWWRTHPKSYEKNKLLKKKRDEELRLLVLTHYGGKCVCCGETEIRFLEVDHINGGGCKERKALFGNEHTSGSTFFRWIIRNKFPIRYQVMCSNCNMAKKGSKVQFCPVHHPELYKK